MNRWQIRLGRRSWHCLAALLASLAVLSACSKSPGLQQQVDDIDQRAAAHATKINNLESQVRSLRLDLDQARQLMEKMSNTITAQADALEKLNAGLQAATRMPAKSVGYPDSKSKTKSKAKTSKKKSH